MKTRLLIAHLVLLGSAAAPLAAQTLYVPGGTGGITSISGNNVGIGTSTPGAKLEVNGTSLLQDLVRVQGAVNVPSGATGIGGELFTSAGNVYFQGVNRTTSAYAPIHFYGSGFALMNGNVGIGTTTPAAALNVVGNVSREVARFQGSTDVTNYRNFVSIYTTNPGFWWELSNQDPAGNGSLNGLALRERSGAGNSIERVYFAQGGNVGIGTTTPTHKLAVNGTIRAKEVIVDTGWSDYVFKPDYQLASLSEVEGAIRRDGHLPGIPSAQEVAEHGVSMGDMQAKLLAKIEELTLHVIAQEKRTTALEKENATLRVEIRKLENTTRTK